MRSDTGRTDSLWMATAPPRVLPPLAEDLRTDVGVIGAGIAGMTTAYLLALEGRRVVVLDDGAVGAARPAVPPPTSSALDDRYHVLERLHGEEARASPPRATPRRSTGSSPSSRAERIACDFQRLDGYLFLAAASSQEILERELEAARRAGLPDVAHVAARARSAPSIRGPASASPARRQFHPLATWPGSSEAIGGAAGGSSAAPT